MRNLLSCLFLTLYIGVSATVAQNGRAPQVPTSSPVSEAQSAANESSELRELPPDLAASFAERHPRYTLGPSDSIDITFAFAPEFNQTATVQPDGFLTLKEVGDVHVAGLTVRQLRSTVTKAYARILNDPVITLTLRDFEKPYFVAGGQLQRPGKYELRGKTRLAEAVQIAGGLLDSAKHSEVLLFRPASNNGVEVRKVNLKRVLAEQNLDEDIVLRPGDMVYVPKSKIAKIRSWIPNPSWAINLP